MSVCAGPGHLTSELQAPRAPPILAAAAGPAVGRA